MKKLLFFTCLALMALTGCNDKKNGSDLSNMALTDSLQRIIAQRDNEINDMMGTLNEIQEGFREINEAENRVDVVKDGEGTNKTKQIKENIRFISTTMKHNRELLAKLQQQLKASTIKGDQLKKTVENLMKQLDEKEQQLQQLRSELDAKDIHISELDETINNQNTNISNLKTESSQNRQSNTAWFVFGTKKELKEQQILVNGKVLQSNFNKSYFTKIDIRQNKEIKLYSNSAKLLTMHPASSYTLAKDATKKYVLTITNPQIFWSTSKYLVILVR